MAETEDETMLSRGWPGRGEGGERGVLRLARGAATGSMQGAGGRNDQRR